MDNYTDFEIECFDYLERLRQSGVTNMFGASPYLQRRFDISHREASNILSKWMKNYEELIELRKWKDEDMSLTIEDIMTILNKKSGLLGLSGGLSSDFRDIDKAIDEENNLQAKITRDAFVHRVVSYVGGYVANMNGVDAIAFTAGVGENDVAVRAEICKYFGYLGVTIDPEKNKVHGEEQIISTPDSKVAVLVVPTNEELMIARDTVALCK